MRTSGWTARITATLDASLRAPGRHALAVRKSHRSCARRFRSRFCRPAKPFAPMRLASTAAHPTFRDDRDTPLWPGWGVAWLRQHRISV